MKNWIINQSEATNIYLIATQKSIWITEKPKEVDINQLIEDKKLTDLRIERYDDIKEFIFVDTYDALEIEFKDDKVDELVLPIEKSVYNDIKSYFLNNLKDTKVKDYSLLKQVQPLAIVSLISGGLTWLLYTMSISLQNGEHIKTSGRRGLIKKIFVAIADFLGPTGSLVVGGLITVFFLYALVNTITKPRKGKVIKITTFTEMSF